MSATDTNRLRNIGIAAHIDAGKTTLTERILYYTGITHKMGDVHDGNTIMDFMDEERERGITIKAAATQTQWEWQDDPYLINIIDTPGHVDFTLEVERSMRVLDGLVVLFSAVHGVEPQSETVWRQANRYHVPRIAFVNKMDLPGAYLESVLDQMRKKLACEPLLIQLPLGEEEFHEGVIDLISQKAFAWEEEELIVVPIPEELSASVSQARQAMLEKLAEYDEGIFNKIFDTPDLITVAEIRAAIRKVTLTRQLVPVLCGSAYKNKGIQPLMDAICAYLPSPDDVKEVNGVHPKTQEAIVRKMEVEAPFTALVFKIALDEQHRKMAFFRVYAGQAKRGAQVLNARTLQKERLANIYKLNGDKRTSLQDVSAGDIAVLANVKDIQTGDSLCDPDHPVTLEDIPYPEPVIGMVVEAKQRGDLDKLEEALIQLEVEDPSLQVLEDEESGNVLLRGMGELHLDVIAHRLRDEFRVPVTLGRPKVNYKEQLTKTVHYTYEYERPEPEPLHAKITVDIGPADEEFIESPGFISGKTRLQFVSQLPDKKIPIILIESIRRGFERMTSGGIIAGYALHGWKVVLRDAETFDHSNELAFELCARNTFRKAAPKAAPIVIEPVMSLEINCPEEYIGNIMGDLNRRRGQPLGMEPRVGYSIIRAKAPLSELFGYAAHIRTLSTGRATASVTFSHYAPLT